MRKTIGFFAENNWLKNETISLVFEGIADACKLHDVNLIRFGYQNANEMLDIGSQHEAIVELIEQFHIDGLIFLGWTFAVHGDPFSRLREKLNIPLYSMGKLIDGIPSNFMHGGYYLRKLLRHMILQHDCRSIAYISPWSYDSRTDVYEQVLTRFNLYQPQFFVDEDLLRGLNMHERAHRSLSILLDERKVKPDAIIAMTAEEAFTIQQDLLRRGFRVPEDIKVCSYEDSKMVQYAQPSITSITFPFKEIGFNGASALIETLRTGTPPKLVTAIGGQIHYRESCGCKQVTNQQLLAEEIKQLGKYHEEHEHYIRKLDEVGQMLLTSYDKSSFYQVLTLSLEEMEIDTCYFYAFSSNSRNMSASRLDYAKYLDEGGEIIDTPNLCKRFHISGNRRFTFVAELLHVTDDYFGFVLLEANKRDVRTYLSLATYISTALKGIHLVHKLEEEIRLRKEKEKELYHFAHFDPLTGLYNRRSFHEGLRELCNTEAAFSLMYLDVDGFKKVNDTLGHTVGDELLVMIAQWLRYILEPIVEKFEDSFDRSSPAIYRLGGDEFTSILMTTDEGKLDDIARQLLAQFAIPIAVDNHEVHIGASIGFSRHPHDAKNPQLLINYADTAMYQSKQFKQTYTLFKQADRGYP